MGDTYFTGVEIAFLIGLIKSAISVSTLFSVRSRNMVKVGLYYRCFTGRYEQGPSSKASLPLLLIYLLFITPVFSWLSVASAAWGYIAVLTNKAPVPDKIKEIQFKIAHIDLPKEKVIELLSELSAHLGIPMGINALEPSSEGNDDPNYLILESGEWHEDVQVSPDKKQYTLSSHPDDYSTKSKRTYQYKIENGKVFERLLSDVFSTYSKESHRVNDKVILESEIRKRHAEKPGLIGLEEELSRLKKDVAWNELRYYKLKYFLLSKHPHEVPYVELRKLIRGDLERFKEGIGKLYALVNERGGQVIETETGVKYEYGTRQSDAEKKFLSALFEDTSLAKLGLSQTEVNNPHQYEQDLLNWLGESQSSGNRKRA